MRTLQLAACTTGNSSCHGNRERCYDRAMSIETLGKLSVLDEHGTAVEVSSLWRERTVVLAFVRHFG